MTPPWPLLADEAKRLEALRALHLLDTPGEERFDRITRLASLVMRAPVAVVSFVDADRQWFKSRVGVQASEIPRDESICGYLIASDSRDTLVVDDASTDMRFAPLECVRGATHVRAYAGRVLRVDGRAVGTLCVMDRAARRFTDAQRAAFVDLAAWAETELRSEHEHALMRELDALQRRTELVLAGVTEGVVGIDRDGTVAFINPAGRQMLGWSDGVIPAETFHESTHSVRADGEPYPVDECPVTEVLRAGGSMPRLSDTFWRSDGQPLPADWSVGAVLDDGQVVGAVVVFDDATSRLRVERMKDEFTSVVSHELRTPLTSLIGALEMLDEGVGGQIADEARLMLDIAVRNAHRLARLVDDIIDVERSTTGQMPLRRAPVKVADLLRSAESTVRGTAVSRDIRIELDPVDAVVWGDEHRLVQVLTNLLGNALRFSEPGSAIRVGTDVADSDVLVHVSDNGPGIAPEAIEHVFDRFWQVDTSARRAHGGSGLGLTISKSIVDAHGGNLTVTSTVGRGSTFTIRLPRRARSVPVEVDRRRTPTRTQDVI